MQKKMNCSQDTNLLKLMVVICLDIVNLTSSVDIGYGYREYWAFTNDHGQLVRVIADEIILQDDVGISTLTPRFKDDEYPENVEVTWTPHAFYSMSNDLEVEGDWSFAFSLKRLEGDIQLVNETVQQKDVSFTLQSVEFTDVSTVILYEQVVTDELLKEWPSVTPVFYVTDDLGHVYMNGLGGSGMSPDNGKTFKGTTAFGAIQKGASQLIIQPVEIASLMYGRGHIEIELEPIIIDLKK